MMKPERPEQTATPSKRKRRSRERGKVRHGGFSELARQGQLPAHRRYLRRYLLDIRAGLVRDLGPTEPDLTTGQKILIDRITQNVAIVRMIEEYVKEMGLFANPQGFLHPSLSTHYMAWQNRISKDLALLGIERRTREAPIDAMSYIREFDKERAKDAEVEEKPGPKKPKAGRTAAKAVLEAHVEDKDPGQTTAVPDPAPVPGDDEDKGPGQGGESE
jgi:hypothetical protein